MLSSSFLRKFICSALLFGALGFTATSCETNSPDPTDPTDPTEEGQSGYLVGKVIGPDGQPLSKATIFTDNTVFKGRGAETKTSSNGTYKIALVKGLGQWIAKGYILKEYNDRVYKIMLDPQNADSFTEEEKPTRDFQWKLQGHVSLNLYYGGTAELQRDLNAYDLRDSENIEFTFVPDGPLIDGSQGKTLKLKCGAAGTNSKDILRDIPIGRYVVSAIYKPTGQQLKVRDSWNDGEFGTEAIIEFYGTESSYRANEMGIGFTDH